MVEEDTLLPHRASEMCSPRRTCQVHLNEGLFHAALLAAIPLNNSSFKGDPLELGYLESDILGSGGEVAVVVAAAVALALLISLVPGSLGKLFRLSIQQLIESFFYAASHQLFNFPLDNFFVQLNNFLGHGLLSPFECLCRNFILPEICKPCLFIFAKLILPFLSRVYTKILTKLYCEVRVVLVPNFLCYCDCG